MPYRSLVVLTLLLVCPSLFAATQGGPIPVPLPLFPASNWWNTDISNAPVDPDSGVFITHIGGAVPLHPDFGGNDPTVVDGVFGFPYIIVNASQPKLTVQFDFAGESDGVTHPAEVSFPFYPVPAEAITQMGWVEGGQPGNVNRRATDDRHILMVDPTNNWLYELYNVWYNGTNWVAGSGAFFDMNTNNRRPEGWTSADAAGLAILPGLVRRDEVFGPGEINHAFRLTVANSNGHVFPASHGAGTTLNALPMGARLRLKPGTDITTGIPAEVQKIFRALKKYGLIVADNGSNMYVSGSYDTLWDNDVLNPAFAKLKASDFEVIERGWVPPVTYVVTLPASVGAGDVVNATVTAVTSASSVVTGYTGTASFTSSDPIATLPANYTFTPGDAGTHTFQVTLRTAGRQRLTATDTVTGSVTGSQNSIVGPATPTGLIAAAATTTRINVSWTASAGASQYQVLRASAGSGGYALQTVTSSTSYPDNAVTAGLAYLYTVRAIDSESRLSGFSAPDAATTIFFTDDALIPNVDIIKAVHIDEVRQAVSAMRATAGLGAASFTDSALAGVAIKTAHVQELRTSLNQARTTLALTALGFTDPTLASTTTVKAAHIQELRNGTK